MVWSLAAARANDAAPAPTTGATASAAYRARLARRRMRWSSMSAGGSGRCLTAERSRRHGPGTSRGFTETGRRGVRRRDQSLQEVDIPSRVQVREELLPKGLDVQLHEMDEGDRGSQVVGRER